MRKIFSILVAALCCATIFAYDYDTWSVTVDGKKMKANVYLPNEKYMPAPVIVLLPAIGGTGTGILGSTPLNSLFAGEGYAFVAINYTMPQPFGSATFPLPINEIRATIREFLEYGVEKGKLDTTFVVVSGFSLGGYLAAMAGLTKNIDSYTVGSETWDFYGAAGSYPVDAVIDFSGPVEFRDIDDCSHTADQISLDQMMIGCSYADCPDKWALASAHTYITKDAPPIFISHGTSDNVVPYCVAENFYNNLQAAGVDCEFYTHDKGHTDQGLGSDFKTKVVNFVHRVRDAKQTQVVEPVNPLTGRFSVAADKQVIFSQGNLQYKASSNKWQFAEKQYDMIGADNSNISSSYSGWIDLFGWGTSGYNSKYPYMTSDSENQYGDGANNIAGTNYDWAEYVTISNGNDEAWRTLTKAEWEYLLQTRANAASKYGNATVAGQKGLVILSDAWTLPTGLTFTAAPTNWTTNTYSADQWTEMENAGAIFLPAAARRNGTSVMSIDEDVRRGYYWTSTANGTGNAYMVRFDEDVAPYLSSDYRSYGYAVRPVRDFSGTPTTIEDIIVTPSDDTRKILHNGTLFILRGNKTYTLTGQEVK